MVKEWLSGLKRWFPKSLYNKYYTIGSNPISFILTQEDS